MRDANSKTRSGRSQIRIMASQLEDGDLVLWERDWLPVVRVSRTSEGMRIVTNEQGWYALIPAHRVVSVKRAW
jgi:hypothetical protein